MFIVQQASDRDTRTTHVYRYVPTLLAYICIHVYNKQVIEILELHMYTDMYQPCWHWAADYSS